MTRRLLIHLLAFLLGWHLARVTADLGRGMSI